MHLTNRVILILILCVSALVRFYRFPEIPFMHDEFSALTRTQFNTLGELIEHGVRPDGHPAGIQLFLYFWIHFVGKAEWLVKLPFAVMGVLSVLLVFLIARKWYNETVALLCTAFVAGIQYTVMYSQIARPYISGLFFSLAMILFWTGLIQNPAKNFTKNSAFYILFSALCAYNHHFSLLFAAIVGISGIFMINRKYLLQYILSGTIIFMLYIPHLGIFMSQLNTGGVGGWLSPPNSSFFLQYLYYIFNYSFLSVATTAAIIIYGLFLAKKESIGRGRHLLFLIWFLLPLIIGYLYSVYRNPVLQFSVLIFSFVPLLLVIFGHIPERKPATNLVLVSAILTVNIFTLINERQYYKIFYNSPYEQIVADYQELSKRPGNTTFLFDSHELITEYYLKAYHADSNFTWFSSFQNEAGFIRFLKEKQATTGYLYFGALSSNKPNTIPIIKQYFPEVIEENHYYGGTTWLYARYGQQEVPNVTLLDFETPAPDGWPALNNDKIVPDGVTPEGHSYMIDSLTEWSPAFSIPLESIISHHNNYIDVAVDVKAEGDLPEVLLVATLEADGKVIHFGGADFRSFFEPGLFQDDWFRVHHSVKLADVDLRRNDLWLKVFVWNKWKDNFMIDNLSVTVRDGNPIIYSLYEKIPD